MSDKYIEKVFLYLVILSLLVHAAVFALIAFLPEKKKPVGREPVMVDLEDLPQLKQAQRSAVQEAKRQAERRQRVARETAPEGRMERERIAPPSGVPRPAMPLPVPSPPRRGGGAGKGTPGRETPQGSDFFVKRRPSAPDVSRLFPSAGKLARLEDSYRKKYGPEVEEGKTRFLNTDDIQFGSFLRRFESAVYGVWRYPPEAVRLGIEGVTPVKITFNRQGEVVKVEILESSGSKILDDEVLRALRMIGPVGGFPRGYDKETFNLIAFFQYNISSGASRGTLY